MRRFGFFAAIALLLVAAWFGIWHSMVAADVARIKASIDYHYHTIKAAQPHVTFKADDVYATGFPFRFHVAVDRATLSQIIGKESYSVSLPRVELSGDAKGGYRVLLPLEFDALYAAEGIAPERYQITLHEAPGVVLRAQKEGAPLTEMVVQLPRLLGFYAALNDKAEAIGFPGLSLPMPLIIPIPADPSRELQLFVGMLREALVYNRSHNVGF